MFVYGAAHIGNVQDASLLIAVNLVIKLEPDHRLGP
jgi:hypothetical protein